MRLMQLVNGKMLSNRNARVRMDVIELRGFGNRLEEAIEKMKKMADCVWKCSDHSCPPLA